MNPTRSLSVVFSVAFSKPALCVALLAGVLASGTAGATQDAGPRHQADPAPAPKLRCDIELPRDIHLKYKLVNTGPFPIPHGTIYAWSPAGAGAVKPELRSLPVTLAPGQGVVIPTQEPGRHTGCVAVVVPR